MAFIPSATVLTQKNHIRKCCVRSWGGDRRLIGRWCAFRGEAIHPYAISQAAWVPRIREGCRAIPRAVLGGGGFLGVGPSEVVVILLVGWLLLGPEKLFALAKDTGKILGELRRTADKAREQFDEAIELDLMAAEIKDKKQIESSEGSDNGTASVVEKFKDLNQSEPLNTSELSKELKSPTSPPTEATAMEDQRSGGVSDAFLDQLKRVSDPNQTVPVEIPDLQIDEEEEVKKLEQQYLEAKQRLERRKLEEQDGPEQNENKSVVREM